MFDVQIFEFVGHEREIGTFRLEQLNHTQLNLNKKSNEQLAERAQIVCKQNFIGCH
jgi:hypothetical protein